jgi:hypothetical protein
MNVSLTLRTRIDRAFQERPIAAFMVVASGLWALSVLEHVIRHWTRLGPELGSSELLITGLFCIVIRDLWRSKRGDSEFALTAILWVFVADLLVQHL